MIDRREDFDLDKMRIAPGDTLTFVRDPRVTVTVLPREKWKGRRFFDYEGRQMALKAVVDELFAPNASSGCCEHWLLPDGRNMSDVYADVYPKPNSSERIFWKKVWGFEPERAPVVGWPDEAGVNNFLAKSDNLSAWVLLTATGSENAAAEERYRALGMAKLYRQTVNTEKVLESAGYRSPAEDFKPDGTYKWPFGLIIREAVRFPDKPLVDELLGDTGGISESQWVRELTPEQVAAVRELRKESVSVLSVPMLERDGKTRLDDVMAYNRQHNHTPSGPPPRSEGYLVEPVDTALPGYTYLLRFVDERAHRMDTPVFKIGYSNDAAQRCAQLNAGLFSGASRCRFEIVQTFKCETAALAHQLEQHMLDAMKPWLVDGERELVRKDEATVLNTWQRVLTGTRWLEGMP